MRRLVSHFSVDKSTTTFKPSSAAHRVIPKFATSTSRKWSMKVNKRGLDTALKILDLIVPKSSKSRVASSHHRLIETCRQDICEVGRQDLDTLANGTMHNKLADSIEVTADMIPDYNESVYNRTTIWMKEDAFLLFFELQKRGLTPDPDTLSYIISSCRAKGTLLTGLQFHGLSIKFGFDTCISLGSSLISFYSKCGQLGDAHRVFQMMPEKDIILWTAIIAGYAQHWQVETSLHLLVTMRRSMLEPNDFTFASLLSACTCSASLGLGRSILCLAIKMGFDGYVHISNALISMYAKCGSIKESFYVFDKMVSKDLISWNSMIFGYAHHGHAEAALELLQEMDNQHIAPDAISYLGALSSCRHAGLVEQGRLCFNSMIKHGIKPEMDHYSCIVDLLGRAGSLDEALDFIKKMPISPNDVIWGSLLSSCRVHGNIWIGIQAAESRLLLEPSCAATHVQLANLYASVGFWNHVAEVRKLMKERGLKTSPGYSWIEVGSKVHRFRVEDSSNTEVEEILKVLDSLADHGTYLVCEITTDLDIQDQELYP